MNSEHELYLHEEILLLALRDETGTIEPGTSHGFAIGGAILAELLLAGRVNITEKRKQKYVELVSGESMGNELLDECLQKIADKKALPAQDWVMQFASSGDLHRVAQGLVKRGILRSEEKKVLFVFNRKVYPERDGKPEQALIRRLEKAIFSDSRELDPRTTVLIALADNSGLLKANFDKARIKNRKKRIKSISEGELMGQVAKEAMEAINAAIMVAVIIPIIITPIIVT